MEFIWGCSVRSLNMKHLSKPFLCIVIYFYFVSQCLASTRDNSEVLESSINEIQYAMELLKKFDFSKHTLAQDEMDMDSLAEYVNQHFLILRENMDIKIRSMVVHTLDELLNQLIVKKILANEDTHSIFAQISSEIGTSFKKFSDSYAASIDLNNPKEIQRHLTNLLFALRVVHLQTRSFLDWTTRREYFSDLQPAPLRSKWKLVRNFENSDILHSLSNALGCNCFRLSLPGSENQIAQKVEETLENILQDKEWLAKRPFRLTADSALKKAKELYKNYAGIDHEKATTIMMLSLMKASYMRYYFDFSPEVFKESYNFSEKVLPQEFNPEYFSSQQSYIYLKDFYQIGPKSYLKVSKYHGHSKRFSEEEQKWFHRIGAIFAVFDEFFPYLPREEV